MDAKSKKKFVKGLGETKLAGGKRSHPRPRRLRIVQKGRKRGR